MVSQYMFLHSACKSRSDEIFERSVSAWGSLQQCNYGQLSFKRAGKTVWHIQYTDIEGPTVRKGEVKEDGTFSHESCLCFERIIANAPGLTVSS